LHFQERPFFHTVTSDGPSPSAETLESTVAEIMYQVGVYGTVLDPSASGYLVGERLLNHPYHSIKRACNSLTGVIMACRDDLESAHSTQYAAPLLSTTVMLIPCGDTSTTKNGTIGDQSINAVGGLTDNESISGYGTSTHSIDMNLETPELPEIPEIPEVPGVVLDVDWIVSVPASLADAKRIMQSYSNRVGCGIILNLDDQVLKWSSDDQKLLLGARRKRDTEIHTLPVSDNVFDVAPDFSNDEVNGRIWYVWIEEQDILAKTAIIINIEG
jgi:hypothetical protein